MSDIAVALQQTPVERRIVSQWLSEDTPRLRALIRALDRVVDQYLAEPLRALTRQTRIGAAEGVWLDYIGERLGRPRPSVEAQDPRFGFAAPTVVTGTGTVAALTALQSITNGSVTFLSEDVTGIDFSVVTDYDGVASVLQTALRGSDATALDAVEVAYDSTASAFLVTIPVGADGSVTLVDDPFTGATADDLGLDAADIVNSGNNVSWDQAPFDTAIPELGSRVPVGDDYYRSFLRSRSRYLLSAATVDDLEEVASVLFSGDAALTDSDDMTLDMSVAEGRSGFVDAVTAAGALPRPTGVSMTTTEEA